MPAPRYRVTGVPLNVGMVNGATAFVPHFTRMAASGAFSYKNTVNGYPGTKAIPVDMNQCQPNYPVGGTVALMGLSRTADGPDAFWPNLYYNTPEPQWWPGAGMPVQMYEPTRPWKTTMIPVPAVNPVIGLRQQSAVLSMGVQSQQSSRTRGMYDTPRAPTWLRRRRKGGGLPNPGGRTDGSV